MNNYQLNPLLEGWKGVTAAATTGLLGGAFAHEIGLANKARNDYNNYISKTGNLRSEIKKAVARLKNEIAYIKHNINEWDDTLKLGLDADALDMEEYQWWQEELVETQKKLLELRQLIKKNDINELRAYLQMLDYESAKFQSFRKAHDKKSKTGAYVKPLAGAIGGGLAYHYADKGIKALRPKAAKLLKRIARK